MHMTFTKLPKMPFQWIKQEQERNSRNGRVFRCEEKLRKSLNWTIVDEAIGRSKKSKNETRERARQSEGKKYTCYLPVTFFQSNRLVGLYARRFRSREKQEVFESDYRR